MAKATTPPATKEETLPAVTAEDLLASMSPEERAEILALTGQNANTGNERIPVLKVNYCDTPDTTGREIKKGNFVYGQSSKTVEIEVEEDGEKTKEDRMEDLGTDLGKSIQVTVLAYRQQYNYYNDDAKQRCASQVFGQGETPVGNNLKHECRSGKCPRRKEGIDKAQKCGCQFIVYSIVTVDGEKKPAISYVKGNNYFPFNDYLKQAGPVPLFFAPTKMKTKIEKQGSVTYYPMSLELDIQNAYSPLERGEYKEQVKGAIGQIEQHKAAQAQKHAAKQIAAPDEGKDAVPFDVDDDIVF